MPVVLPRDAATQEASIVSRPRRYRSSSIPSVDTAATVRPSPSTTRLLPLRAGLLAGRAPQENGKIEADTGPPPRQTTTFSRKRPGSRIRSDRCLPCKTGWWSFLWNSANRTCLYTSSFEDESFIEFLYRFYFADVFFRRIGSWKRGLIRKEKIWKSLFIYLFSLIDYSDRKLKIERVLKDWLLRFFSFLPRSYYFNYSFRIFFYAPIKKTGLPFSTTSGTIFDRFHLRQFAIEILKQGKRHLATAGPKKTSKRQCYNKLAWSSELSCFRINQGFVKSLPRNKIGYLWRVRLRPNVNSFHQIQTENYKCPWLLDSDSLTTRSYSSSLRSA